MNHNLDLHGLSHEEAILEAESFLIEASFDRVMVAEIITGKSKTMQDSIIKEVILPHKFSYHIPTYNEGMIIVTKDEIL
jgi:DNA-nicking Smr family endonuclease